MTRLRLIYTDILWSFLAGLHGHSSQSRVSFNNIGSALKLRQKQNQSYGTFWYPKIQTAWSNLGCWFWCNYILYTFVRSLNLIYAFCTPILGDEQHFGASTELSQVDEASGCSVCEDDCDTAIQYDVTESDRACVSCWWGSRGSRWKSTAEERGQHELCSNLMSIFWQCRIGCENTNRFKEYKREVYKSCHLLPALVWSLQRGFGQVSWD